MKKMMPLMLAILLFLSVAACDSSGDSDNLDNSTGSTQEQRDGSSNSMVDDGQESSTNLEAQVSEALSTNLPGSQLTVQVSERSAMISGTVLTQEQFDQIGSLVMEVKGIRSVIIDAEVG